LWRSIRLDRNAADLCRIAANPRSLVYGAAGLDRDAMANPMHAD
jgi:hypothetical protein